MSQPPTKPSAATLNARASQWSLEVVRGRAVGHRYALDPGETVIGNDLASARGLNLGDQEGNSPRKMAARHAALTWNNGEVTIRDLDTPGGTFINQKRLLAGQARRLENGDVIQLGGVQLRVNKEEPAPVGAPAASARQRPDGRKNSGSRRGEKRSDRETSRRHGRGDDVSTRRIRPRAAQYSFRAGRRRPVPVMG